ncbi:hypothetical protein EV126DRAFT_509185, partial [Verticillium dahliae]
MPPASKRSNSSLPAGAHVEISGLSPRLPVPTLEETAARYVKTLRPLLSDSEFATSKKAVEEFIKPGGVGSR